MRVPLPFLALLLVLLLSGAGPSDGDLSRYETLIKDVSPASTAVLDEPAYLNTLRRADPDKADRLLKQKSFLKDLDAILRDSHGDSWQLRDILRSRFEYFDGDLFSDLGFGPEAVKLSRWAAAYYQPDVVSRLDQALWAWSTLDTSDRDLLARRHFDRSKWEGLGFPELDKIMVDLKKSELHRLKVGSRVGGAKPDSLQILRTVRAIGVDLDEKSRRLLGPALDPALSLEARLVALNRYFDGSQAAPGGSIRPANPAAKPAPAPEKLTAGQAGLLGPMLSEGYLGQAKTVPTTAQAFATFYGARKPAIRIVDSAGEYFGQYDPDAKEIRVDQGEVESWLKARHKSGRDLLTDKVLFDQLVLETSPIFVHEATHEMDWASRGGHPSDNHALETHAMFVQTTYAYDLVQRDPRMRDFLDNHQADSALASAQAQLLDTLIRRGPRAFREEVAYGYYPEFPTLPGGGALSQHQFEFLQRMVDQELARRGDRSKRTVEPTPDDKVPRFENIDQARQYFKKAPTHELEEHRGRLVLSRHGAAQANQADQRWWKGEVTRMDEWWAANFSAKKAVAR